MGQRASRINYRLCLILAGLFVLLTGACWANDVPSGDSSPGAPATAAQSALGQVLAPQEQSELIALIRTAHLADLRWPDFSDYRDQVLTFYEAGAYTLPWISNKQPTQQALALIKSFKDAAQEGLDSEDYDGQRWDDRVAQLRAASPEDLIHFDLGLTVCAMRYVSDLAWGESTRSISSSALTSVPSAMISLSFCATRLSTRPTLRPRSLRSNHVRRLQPAEDGAWHLSQACCRRRRRINSGSGSNGAARR
jgi:hypothetical protein